MHLFNAQHTHTPTNNNNKMMPETFIFSLMWSDYGAAPGTGKVVNRTNRMPSEQTITVQVKRDNITGNPFWKPVSSLLVTGFGKSWKTLAFNSKGWFQIKQQLAAANNIARDRMQKIALIKISKKNKIKDDLSLGKVMHITIEKKTNYSARWQFKYLNCWVESKLKQIQNVQ